MRTCDSHTRLAQWRTLSRCRTGCPNMTREGITGNTTAVLTKSRFSGTCLHCTQSFPSFRSLFLVLLPLWYANSWLVEEFSRDTSYVGGLGSYFSYIGTLDFISIRYVLSFLACRYYNRHRTLAIISALFLIIRAGHSSSSNAQKNLAISYRWCDHQVGRYSRDVASYVIRSTWPPSSSVTRFRRRGTRRLRRMNERTYGEANAPGQTERKKKGEHAPARQTDRDGKRERGKKSGKRGTNK